MSCHTYEELMMLQGLPLEQKIIMTKQRIEAWYQAWTKVVIYNEKTGRTRAVTCNTSAPGWEAKLKLKPSECVDETFPGQVYVSFSGGKDSTVLKHIVDSMYSDVPSIFVNTGLEYPEIQKFVREVKAGKHACFSSDVEILQPEMRFDEVIKKYGYPIVSKDVARCVYWGRRGSQSRIERLNGTYHAKNGTLSMFNCNKWRFLLDAPFEIGDECCAVMKKRPCKQYEKQTGRKPILGLMASESVNRRSAWIQSGCNAFALERPQSQPLAFWGEQDILHYIKQFNVPYCPVYGEIKAADAPEIDGQMNWLDYLGCYESQDRLTTTGCTRTGCMFCMFGCHLEKEPNRFQRMKITHPKQYAYCMNELELKEVLEYIGVPYE